MKLRYFSGFSGIGGFDQGITQVLPDAECVGFSEVDKYAIKIYEKNFPDRTNYGDIRRIDTGTLPDFDMFCGGFPCQDLSLAGKRAGLCGTRSGLFFEIIRIIREKQPRLVFLENVKGLFSSKNGWDFARILIELDESGYDVEWQCLSSKNFGVPQNRERVFIIGHLRGKPRKSVFPIEEELREISKAGNLDGIFTGTLSTRNQSGQAQWDGSTTLIASGVNNPSRGMEPRKDGIASTIKPQSGSQSPRVLILAIKGDLLSRIRRLTPLECERLQGYPDGWTEGISDTQRYKTLGNAVTTTVIKAIMERLKCNGNI